ncbi:tyrosine-type recombinase/integrase [Sphingobium yanoikuyae]|uniref:Tyrosine-type recombinase/integrase n=1 Tax=Sphingobium yanoikuyae TaxID=13690 RepID=A0A6P1GBN7_SPHYA|nr:site-specific integrase [Sphingobium yanoikuyae]QHD65740.1 tyrosine-type recombinase/integrase [Sphingobium yanoikuyae]
MGKLTTIAIKNAKAGRHADGDGLYLLVKPTGGRSWLLRVQYDGKRRDIGLGSVDLSPRKPGADPVEDIPILERRVLTLAEAREKGAILRRLAKAGRDAVAERDKDRRSSRTFEDAAKAYKSSMAGTWSKPHGDRFINSLTEHIFPHIGAKSVDQIDAASMRDALVPIWTIMPVTAGKLRQRVAAVLNYSNSEGWRPTEAPLRALSFMLGERPTGGNYPAMPFEDVPAFMAELADDTETMGKLALRFLILTGARSGEVRKTTWAHIDLDGQLWNRPAEIMKGRKAKAHSVTLNDQAIAILRRVAELGTADPDAFVFPNSKGQAMSDMTISKIMRDKGLDYVPHGFRSSFRDWSAERMPSIPDPVAEAALAHVVPDKVIAAYKRTTFIQLRRELLDAWGRYVAGQSNVVRLKEVG